MTSIDAGILFTLGFLVLLQARVIYQLGAVRSELEAVRNQVDALDEKMESQVRYFLQKLWDGQYPRM